MLPRYALILWGFYMGWAHHAHGLGWALLYGAAAAATYLVTYAVAVYVIKRLSW